MSSAAIHSGAAIRLIAAPAVGALYAAALLLAAAVTASASAAEIPRTADGKPNFTGIWQSLSGADFGLEPHIGRKDAPPSAGVVEGGEIPYQPWALEQRNKNFAARETLDPRTKCFSLGVPRGTYAQEPFQIFQRPRDLTVLYELGHSIRTIHTNGTLHPEGPIEWWLGDSRGRWEGDTLVVDIVDFNNQSWLDRAGNFHSEQLHVVERWTYIDADHIEYKATLEDPKVYTRPWNLSLVLYRRVEPDVQLIENYCFTEDFDKYYPLPGPQTRATR